MPNNDNICQPPHRAGYILNAAVVIAASLAMAATLPGRTVGLGLIAQRLIEDIPKLTELNFAWINGIAAFIGAACCLPAGLLIDRFGTRRVLAVVLLLLTAAVYAMTLATNVTQLAIALTLTRAIGQSMLSVLSLAVMGKWFGPKASWSMGAYAVLLTLFMATAYDTLGKRILALDDWRIPWQEAAFALLFITPLIVLCAFSKKRRAPRSRADRDEPSETQLDPQDATLADALRTRCFWAFALAMSLFAMAQAGVLLLLQPILAARGIDEQAFQTTQLIGFFAGLAANLVGGALIKRIPINHLLVGAMLILTGALLGLTLLNQPWQAYTQGAAFGISGGLITVLFFSVWVRAFGTTALGKIQGAAQLLTVLGSASGPVLIAQSNASASSYAPALIALAIAALALSAFAAITKVPQAHKP